MTGPRLHVDLARVRDNLGTLRARVDPARIMVVVKDDAYGHGVDEIVRAAASVGVGWFGSFDLPTARAVRAAASGVRIFAWATPEPGDAAAAVEAGIELGVGDAGVLEAVAAESTGRGLRVHLKIDTGLHRNGVRPEDWDAFVSRAAAHESAGDIVVTGIWSHLAEASDDDDDLARAAFERAVVAARSVGLSPDVLHLAASAAGFERAEFRHDVVRFGAFAYGVRSADGVDLDGIAPAATLLAPVVEVGDGRVRIGIGSLDGLPSTLAGRVSVGTPAGPRDLLAVDPVTCTLEGWTDAAIGDDVAVFGPGHRGESSATTLAEAIDTVGEEILVRLSPLIPRWYTG